MPDHEWEGIGLYQALINLIANSTSAALGVLKLAGGTMTGDIVLSTGHSLNDAVKYFWRGLGPVTRTYTSFAMGAVGPTVQTPTWGGKTIVGTGATQNRMSGAFTPVGQTSWSAIHTLRYAGASDAGSSLFGVGVKISGGTDIYTWCHGSTVANTYIRAHEVAGVFTATVLIATGGFEWNKAQDWKIVVPTRASEATAGNVAITHSADGGEYGMAVDTVSLAPAGTGIVHSGVAAAAINAVATILAEKWSGT